MLIKVLDELYISKGSERAARIRENKEEFIIGIINFYQNSDGWN